MSTSPVADKSRNDSFSKLFPLVKQWCNKHGILQGTRAQPQDLFLTQNSLAAIACFTSHLDSKHCNQVIQQFNSIQSQHMEDYSQVFDMFDTMFNHHTFPHILHLFFSLVYFAQTTLTLSIGSLVTIEYDTSEFLSSRSVKAHFRSNKNKRIFSISCKNKQITLDFDSFSIPVVVPSSTQIATPFLPATCTSISFLFEETIQAYAAPLSQTLFALGVVLTNHFIDAIYKRNRPFNFPLLVKDAATNSLSPFIVSYLMGQAKVYADTSNLITRSLSYRTISLLTFLKDLQQAPLEKQSSQLEQHGHEWRLDTDQSMSFFVPLPGASACLALDPQSLSFSQITSQFPDVDENILMPAKQSTSTRSQLVLLRDQLQSLAVNFSKLDQLMNFIQNDQLDESQRDGAMQLCRDLSTAFTSVYNDIMLESASAPPFYTLTPFDQENAQDQAIQTLYELIETLRQVVPLLSQQDQYEPSFQDFIALEPIDTLEQILILLQNTSYIEQPFSMGSELSSNLEPSVGSELSSNLEPSVVSELSSNLEPSEDEESLPEPDYDQF